MAQDEEFAGANYAPIEETGEVHQEWLRQGERSAAEEESSESRRTAEAKTKAQAEELKRQQESRRIEEERLAAEEAESPVVRPKPRRRHKQRSLNVNKSPVVSRRKDWRLKKQRVPSYGRSQDEGTSRGA